MNITVGDVVEVITPAAAAAYGWPRTNVCEVIEVDESGDYMQVRSVNSEQTANVHRDWIKGKARY